MSTVCYLQVEWLILWTNSHCQHPSSRIVFLLAIYRLLSVSFFAPFTQNQIFQTGAIHPVRSEISSVRPTEWTMERRVAEEFRSWLRICTWNACNDAWNGLCCTPSWATRWIRSWMGDRNKYSTQTQYDPFDVDRMVWTGQGHDDSGCPTYP